MKTYQMIGFGTILRYLKLHCIKQEDTGKSVLASQL